MRKIPAIIAGIILALTLAFTSQGLAHASAGHGETRSLHLVKAVNGHIPPGHYLIVPQNQLATCGPTQSCEVCAGDPTQGAFCLNAWNGGPLVKAYTGQVTNDDFQLNCGSQNCNIEDQNTGTYVGDYQNSKYNAKAGLVGYGGWGTNFGVTPGDDSCGNDFLLHNFHWAANLSFGFFDGAQAYLNTGDDTCFQLFTW